ncbi:MAG TPA: hypothetical protein VK607_10565 [Kofleriaceae bacterium]|nr:hypothetical protein [Kofleriaceae bacterium]
MVTFSYVGERGAVLGLALTRECIERLQSGDVMTIQIVAEGCGADADGAPFVVIPEGPLEAMILMYGEDHAAINAELAPHINEATRQHTGDKS